MTQTINDSRDDYVGNSSVTTFAYTFRILDADEVLVQVITDATGAVVTKTRITDYTVTDVDEAAGGDVEFITAPITGETVVLTRNVPRNQLVDYRPNDPFPAETTERTLDQLTQITQELSETVKRCVKLPTHKVMMDGEIATGFLAEYVLRVNVAGTGFELVAGSTAIDIDVLDGLTLTAFEVEQLQNINTTSISTTQWSWLGTDDQSVNTTANVTFNTVNGRDVATDGTKLDGIEALADVTDEANVTDALDGATLDSVTVATGDKILLQDVSDSDNLKTATSQSIADLFANQSLDTTDSPTFVDVTVGTTPVSEIRDQSYGNQNTGLVAGGALSVGTDTAKFDISAGTGYVVDAYTDPANPVLIQVSWTAFDEVTTTHLATAEVSSVLIDSNGDVVQIAGTPSEEDQRDYIILGGLSHPDNVSITETVDRPLLAIQGHHSFIDMCMSVGLVTRSGNVYSANGANVNIDKTAGSTFGGGINWSNSQKLPNITVDPSGTTLTFIPVHQDGSGGITLLTPTTSIDTNFYDDGSGTLAALTANKHTIHRIDWQPGSATTLVEYGQTVYNSQSDAESGLATEVFTTDVSIVDQTTLRAFLIVKSGATDLTVSADAKFMQASRSRLSSGTSGGGGSGGADTALSNLAGVAVNTDLISDTNSTDSLGSTGIRWANTWSDEVNVTNNIIVGGTVDGRDVATDGTKLDGVEALADVTDETNVITALDGATISAVTLAADDKVLIQETSSGDALKTVTTQAIADLVPTAGRLVSQQTFTADGTWTKPAGVTHVLVIVTGGGGAGGGTDDTSALECAGGGGGGGGGTAVEFIDVSGTSSETITVGVGGVGAVDTTGPTGGTSSFGAFCSATGGVGGIVGTDSATIDAAAGGSGGLGAGGDVNMRGQGGAYGFRIPEEFGCGGGGGSTYWGAGGRGRGTRSTFTPTVGGDYGGGGSGSGIGISETGVAGGNGGDGVVQVWEYSE